jgi:ATP-dependent helicase Lhr and Lhr-like helicase
VLYVSPLKALINDQFGRLELLCRHVDISVHRWHGDVAASAKARIRRSPDGIVIITPESLEALFVTGGTDIERILGGLRYVVVDELHAFLGTERGAQLQSLMHRVEVALRRRVPRIALSATLADNVAACDFLRPGDGGNVHYLDLGGSSEFRLRVYGYMDRKPAADDDLENAQGCALASISSQLYRLRGADNLIFANSRGNVEEFSDRLTVMPERARVPLEFLPHHGNLSKEMREHVEGRLKDAATPTTAICTSTLEMGIDIGSVGEVAQVGAPPGVAALRQRLGRSPRRGNNPPTLRIHVAETVPDPGMNLDDELRTQLVQTTAMVELMLDKWLEPPNTADLHLSTLIQQVLSVIAQEGGASPSSLHGRLCGRGPFRRVAPPMFAALLRAMGAAELITQAGDGLLLAGRRGDRIINHYSFYAAFQTAEEFRVLVGSKSLGTLPIDRPLSVGSLLIFAGQRWRILEIDTEKRTIQLTPSSGGKAPKFPRVVPLWLTPCVGECGPSTSTTTDRCSSTLPPRPSSTKAGPRSPGFGLASLPCSQSGLTP